MLKLNKPANILIKDHLILILVTIILPAILLLTTFILDFQNLNIDLFDIKIIFILSSMIISALGCAFIIVHFFDIEHHFFSYFAFICTVIILICFLHTVFYINVFSNLQLS